MNVFLSLSLWLALMMSSCRADAGSHEEQTTIDVFYDSTVGTYYDDETPTPTPDYDYTATFDYYYVTGHYPHEVHSKASGIGRLSPVLLLGLAVHQMWN